MTIWFGQPTVEQLNGSGADTMVSHLGIVFTAVGDDTVTATMPVDQRTRQPYGLLHGGASVALAETLGSVAASLVVDASRFQVVGLEINANHVRGVRAGLVTGTVSPLHLGRSTHVWQTMVHDEKGRLVCVSRLTIKVLERS